MPTITISYSPELEVTRVQKTLARIPWYKEHGYAAHLKFPPGITLESLSDAVPNAVHADYLPDMYQAYETRLSSTWSEAMKEIDLATLPLSYHPTYTVRLTRYGVGGSYHMPNIVIMNITSPKEPAMILLHEITHLAIEERIQAAKLGQADKERLVDLLTLRMFPTYATAQDRFADNPRVNNIFEKCYPDIDALFSQLATA